MDSTRRSAPVNMRRESREKEGAIERASRPAPGPCPGPPDPRNDRIGRAGECGDAIATRFGPVRDRPGRALGTGPDGLGGRGLEPRIDTDGHGSRTTTAPAGRGPGGRSGQVRDGPGSEWMGSRDPIRSGSGPHQAPEWETRSELRPC